MHVTVSPTASMKDPTALQQ